jgi:transcriptional regulator of heat shock response
MLPQEFTRYDKTEQITVFRLDFMATVRTDSGEYRKILIEVQKATKETDLMRFRGYLGEQYKKEDNIDGVLTALPITTIYIVGFTLPEIPTACVKVGREYWDLINNVLLAARSPFIEKLTHDSYIVQTKLITGRYQTRLDKLLCVFEQAYFTEATDAVKHFNHNPDDADMKNIIDILHHIGTDPVERKELDDEIEYHRTLKEHLGNEYAVMVKERDKAIAEIVEKDKEIVEKDKEIVEKDKEIVEKDKEIAELRRLLQTKEKTEKP